jgi:alkylation response protein AidB-like acyl-CoA dehydrogenase
MDNSVPPEVEELAARTREFIRDVVIPVEQQVAGVMHDAPDDLRRSLQKQASDAGLLAPHVPKEWGGCGLDVRGQAVVFEAAGYSLLGPLALNCSAPDEGNMHLLEVVASEEQKQKYLRPLATGEIRSCFAMTEPAPGAGSDRGQGWRRLAHRRPQVVHQRRTRGWVQHLYGPHQRISWRPRRCDDVSRRRRQPRYAGQARHRDARSGLVRRA